MVGRTEESPPMPAPRTDGRNPTKTRLDASESKQKTAIAKKEQMAAWMQKMQKDGARMDKRLADLSKRAKVIEDLMKKKDDTKKAVEDFADMLAGMLKELKTFSEVPVPGKMPEMPKNTIAMGSLLPVLLAAIAWWKLARKAK
jgi:DNA repair exonuclease SbcCD ATPase subunit